MRCNCCDRVLGDAEIQLAPDNSFEPCATCMEIIMDTAYSDGFTRPVDEEFELEEDEEFDALDLGVEEVENFDDDTEYRSYFDHCDVSPVHDPDDNEYD